MSSKKRYMAFFYPYTSKKEKNASMVSREILPLDLGQILFLTPQEYAVKKFQWMFTKGNYHVLDMTAAPVQEIVKQIRLTASNCLYEASIKLKELAEDQAKKEGKK
jgi:hypothetical protein